MAYEPDIILLDEPFSALDMYLKDQLQRELSEMLKDYGGTVILVSHNRDEVYRFSEELLIIDQGRIAVSGKDKRYFCASGQQRSGKAYRMQELLAGKAERRPYGGGAGLGDYPAYHQEDTGRHTVDRIPCP